MRLINASTKLVLDPRGKQFDKYVTMVYGLIISNEPITSDDQYRELIIGPVNIQANSLYTSKGAEFELKGSPEDILEFGLDQNTKWNKLSDE